VLLSRAPALADSSRCTSFAVHNVAVKRTLFELYGCDADPPRHAFYRGWKSLSRMTDRPLTLPVVHQAPPRRLHAPTGGFCDAPSLARRPSGPPLREMHAIELT
jgi:hypothetical protein